jgi:hypothetical protein
MLVGWTCGIARAVLWTYTIWNEIPEESPLYYTIPVLFSIPFFLSPVWMVLLCWNNVDLFLFGTLRKQFQFWIISALCLWVLVVR